MHSRACLLIEMCNCLFFRYVIINWIFYFKSYKRYRSQAFEICWLVCVLFGRPLTQTPFDTEHTRVRENKDVPVYMSCTSPLTTYGLQTTALPKTWACKLRSAMKTQVLGISLGDRIPSVEFDDKRWSLTTWRELRGWNDTGSDMSLNKA